METDVSDLSDADDTEKLGEKLFSLVEELDPSHANGITGEIRRGRSTQAALE